MKVYMTKRSDDLEKVVLVTYPSQKSFEDNVGWLAPEVILVATTKDLDGYEFPHEGGMIRLTEDEIESRNLLHEKYLEVSK